MNVIRFFQWIRLDDLLFVSLDLIAAILIYRILERLRERAGERDEKDVPPSDFQAFPIAVLYWDVMAFPCTDSAW